MIKTVIIEDEKLIAADLKDMLMGLSPDMEVKAILGSVKESLEYFAGGYEADLIFSDIQLPDGLSFDIFSKIKTTAPIVFITGFDDFIVNAFEYNGIDYLLKPVTADDLSKVLQKYRSLEKHFAGRNAFFESFAKKKERLIVRKGLTNMVLKLEDVVFFYAESKMVFAVDKEGKKYVCEHNLSELEEMLDSQVFFRANRQYLINAAYIKGYKPHEKVKLSVDMHLAELYHPIIISQETAREFRQWINQL